MVVATKLMTADELLRLPRGRYRYELVKGELIQMTPAGARHGVVALKIGARLEAFVESKQLGVVCAAETGFVLAYDPDTVRAPDAAFISKARIPKEGMPEAYWPLAPDLAVEVVSPRDTASEVQTKVVEWINAGTRLVWVVDPKTQTVTVYHSLAEVRVLTVNDMLDGADVVPGFESAVKEIFA
ncbi:MAG: Uma2 family endonuclease [Chloroflexi bacterium]|nr:Uma2 family endonuclease [Chloroflexota bacterium]